MFTYTADQARVRFDEMLDQIQQGPIRVVSQNKVVGVMVSAEDYEAVRQFYVNRLVKTMNETANSAAAAGLTPEILDSLLADES